MTKKKNVFLARYKNEMLWGLQRVLQSEEALEHLPEAVPQALRNAFVLIRRDLRDERKYRCLKVKEEI